MRALLVLGAVAAIALAPAVAQGHAGRHRTTLSEIEREVMCPTCGTTLQLASSPLAERQRAFILARVERNQTKAQIKAALVTEFGEQVLANPPRRGFDVAVYAVPLGTLSLVLLMVIVAIRRWRRRPPQASPPRRDVLAEADALRLDDELARYGGL